MSGKGNMKFWWVVSGVVLLFGGLGWFVYFNDKKVDEWKYAQGEVTSQSVPSPRNVNAAATTEIASKESEQHVVDRLNITFRAVGLGSSEADQQLAFNVLSEMRSSPYFDPTKTDGVGEVSGEVPLNEAGVKSEAGQTPGTFSFKIVAKLKRPLTL